MKILLVLIILLLLASPIAAETTLTLQEAIEFSLEHSFRIKSSHYDSAAARCNYKAAKSLRFPSLSLTGSSFYIDKVPSAEFPFGQELELGSKENHQFDLRLSIPIFTGGRISNQIGIQKENWQAESFNLEAERLITAYNCRRAYLSLVLSKAVVSSAEASLDRIKIIRQNVQNLHKNGMTDSLDILETEQAYQKALQTHLEKETAGRNAAALLAQIMGLSSERPIMPPQAVPIPKEPPRRPIILLDEINRAELKAFDNRIQGADYFAKLNRSEYFPVISTYIGYSAGKPNRDFLNNEWNDNIVVGLTANWEFNLGGKAIHAASSATKSAFSMRMLKKELEESLSLRADIALENLRLSYHTFTISQKEYGIAREKYRLAEERQKAGYLNVNHLLEMEAELTSSEQMYYASITNYYISEAEYLYAIGSPRIYGGL